MPTQPLQVENTAFLVEKLASECAPLQYVRELTVNSIQAIQERMRGGWQGEGQILWDVDWTLTESRPGMFKMQISDNGTGMTGTEMERYINSLASSGREQSFAGNYGLGAKITAGVANPQGLVYKSWVSGRGAIAILHKDTDANVYGLTQWELPDGSFAHHAPLHVDVKPQPVDTHGTAVVLLGRNETECTMKPEGQPLKWLIKYLNTRFYEIPDGITIKVRDFSRAEPSDWPNSPEVGMDAGGSQLRTIRGMKQLLGRSEGIVSGVTELSNAKVFWHILPPDPIQQRDIWETSAQIGALYQGELYEMRVGRQAYAKIREFGVIFGYERIVLYVQPSSSISNLAPNTARSQLLASGEPLPWERWALEFRQLMPTQIKDMMDDITSASEGRDHREAIRRRLRDIKNLFNLSRYRRHSTGPLTVGGSEPGGTVREGGGTPRVSAGNRGGGRGGSAGALYGAFLTSDGDRATESSTNMNEPQVIWVSVDEGSRALDDDLEDRAARYSETDNRIYANQDFRVFKDLTTEVASRYPGAPADEVTDVVREWFEQQLIEAVLGVRSLKGSSQWDTTTLDKALSPEAFTTAVMPRYNMIKQVTRALGARFGAAASQAVQEVDN